MIDMDKVARGISAYYDAEIRPTINGPKSVLYGVALGVMLQHPERITERYRGILEALGVMQNNMLDIEALAAETKKQIERSNGVLPVRILGDEFTFHASDVDNLLAYIGRA